MTNTRESLVEPYLTSLETLDEYGRISNIAQSSRSIWPHIAIETFQFETKTPKSNYFQTITLKPKPIIEPANNGR